MATHRSVVCIGPSELEIRNPGFPELVLDPHGAVFS